MSQFLTFEELKTDITDHFTPYVTDGVITDLEQKEIDEIFIERIKIATNVYFLVDKENFIVFDKNSCGNNLFKCTIQCDDEKTVQKLLSNIQVYTDQGVEVKRLDRALFISQIEKRSYLYLALFEGTVVKWIHQMRKLIPVPVDAYTCNIS